MYFAFDLNIESLIALLLEGFPIQNSALGYDSICSLQYSVADLIATGRTTLNS